MYVSSREQRYLRSKACELTLSFSLFSFTFLLFPPRPSFRFMTLCRIRNEPRIPIRPRPQFPRASRRIPRRILILDQRLQKLPHLVAPRIRRIVVDGKHANGAKASAVDDGRLTRQGAIAIDTRVDASRDDGAKGEKAGLGIKNRGVDLGAASQACLDERWVDAVGGCEGGDCGIIDIEAVAERE